MNFFKKLLASVAIFLLTATPAFAAINYWKIFDGTKLAPWNASVTDVCFDYAGTNCISSTSVGDVRGPAGATDNAFARYSSATGKLIQDSALIGDGSGAISGLVSLTDGVASWITNALSGFTSIGGTTITDGTASLTGGSLTDAKLGTLTSNGFVKTSGSDGTLSVDTSTYLTAETDPIVGAIAGIPKADGAGNISAAVAGTDYAEADQTMYIGTTAVNINRATAALTLGGITLTAPEITAGGTINLSAAGSLGIAENAGANTITIGGATSTVDIPGLLTAGGFTLDGDVGSGDINLYDPVNDGNPIFNIGSTTANKGTIQAVYDSGAQTLDYFSIATTSAGEGNIVFSPAGSIGIGTTAPGAKLDIVGDVNIGDGTNNLTISDTGDLTLEGTAKGTLVIRPQINFDEINKRIKPTLAQRGVFFGYSMPVYDADNEEIFLSQEVPQRWDGESDIIVHATVALAAGEDVGDKFQMQMSWEHDGIAGDIIPATSNDVPIETTILTDRNDAWDIYEINFTIDYDIDGEGNEIVSNEMLGMRLRRIAASTLEATDEIVVMKIDTHFIVDKIFGE